MTLHELEQSLFSVGLSTLKSRPVFTTPKASVVLSKLQTTRKGKVEEFDLLAKAVTLSLDQNGKIPNPVLIPPNALLICFAGEEPLDVSRWTLRIASNLDPYLDVEDEETKTVLLGTRA